MGGGSPDLTRGPHPRPALAHLAALLLHFPRRAHKACLQQVLVDQGEQLPPLPGFGHARDLPPVGSPARPPQSPPATALVPLDLPRPTSGSLLARAARHAGNCSLISQRGRRGGGSEGHETSHWLGGVGGVVISEPAPWASQDEYDSPFHPSVLILEGVVFHLGSLSDAIGCIHL